MWNEKLKKRPVEPVLQVPVRCMERRRKPVFQRPPSQKLISRQIQQQAVQEIEILHVSRWPYLHVTRLIYKTHIPITKNQHMYHLLWYTTYYSKAPPRKQKGYTQLTPVVEGRQNGRSPSKCWPSAAGKCLSSPLIGRLCGQPLTTSNICFAVWGCTKTTNVSSTAEMSQYGIPLRLPNRDFLCFA